MFRWSKIVQNEDFGGDVTRTYDLGVNPLSCLLISLRMLNDTGTLANMVSYLTAAAAMLKVQVLFRGEAVISANGQDLAALSYLRQGCLFPQSTHANTNNDRRCVVLPLFFGRRAFDVETCFPASQRGDLVLQVDVDDAATGYDDLQMQVEMLELLDAKPSRFERTLSIAHTFPATGTREVELFPTPGNRCRGLLIWGTTGVTGGTPAPTWGTVHVRADGIEMGYQSANFDTLVGRYALWGRQPPVYDAHKHIVTTDGNVQAELATLAGPYAINSGGWEKYAFLDFDPTRDDRYSVNLSDIKRFQVGGDNVLAEAVRVLQIDSVDTKTLRMA